MKYSTCQNPGCRKNLYPDGPPEPRRGRPPKYCQKICKREANKKRREQREREKDKQTRRHAEPVAVGGNLRTLVWNGATPREQELEAASGKDKVDYADQTLLHLAAVRDNAAAIDPIIKDDPSILERRNIFGRTALIIAVIFGHVKTVKALIEAGCNVEAKRKIKAVTDEFKIRIDGRERKTDSSKSKKNKVEVEVEVEVDGRTPLHTACYEGYLEIAHLLCGRAEDGLDDYLDLQDRGGMTAMHLAAYADQIELIEFLLSKKACSSVKDVNGMTPLFLAILRDNIAAVRALKVTKADLEQTDAYGRTALAVAEQCRNAEQPGNIEEIIKFLLEILKKS